MPMFRLLNLRTLDVEEHDLEHHSVYLAASRAWIDNASSNQRDEFNTSFGGKGLRIVVSQACPDVNYCWVDRLCINQGDKQDKFNQIPLREKMFRQARAVVVLINKEIGADQTRIDELTDELAAAITMYDNEAYKEEGLFWQQGVGKECMVYVMHGLLRLASTVWATRVWTLREYVLAQQVYWIGLDYQPITIDDRVISAVPDICNTLVIEEALTSEMQVVFKYLRGMASFRLGAIDRTRAMEHLGNRVTKKPVDEVYGSMSASGVIIKPIAGESKFDAWRRWCETAITQGDIRWILLPVNGKTPPEEEEWSCVLPHFVDRDKLSSSSCLDYVKPLRSATIVNGCVTVLASKVGSVELIKRLGKIHESRDGLIYRDILIMLSAQAKRKLSLQFVSAFGGGRYYPRQAKALAQVIVQSYNAAVESIVNRSENLFRPVFHDEFQLEVWNDFMQLQETQMIGLNEGIGYLCRVTGNHIDEEVVTVIVTGGFHQYTSLEALDLEAKSPDGRSILMIVQSSPQKGINSVHHRVAMALPVSDSVCQLWQKQPLEIVRLDGRDCYYCDTNRNGSRPQTLLSAEPTEEETSNPAHMLSLSVMRALLRQLSIVLRKDGNRRSPKVLRRFKLTHLRRRRTISLKALK